MSDPVGGTGDTLHEIGQPGEHLPDATQYANIHSSVLLESFGIHNLSINNHASPPLMDESSQTPFPVLPQRRAYDNGSPIYFQVTTWLTSLRRSSWTVSDGAHTRQETVEQLIGQRTTHTTVDLVAEARDDHDPPRFISNIANQVRFRAWLPSFRRTGPIQTAGEFASRGEPASEFTGPGDTESWNPQYNNGPGHHIGATVNVDSVQGELSHPPLVGRRGPSMYKTTHISHKSPIIDPETDLPLDEDNESAVRYSRMPPNPENASGGQENGFEFRHATTPQDESLITEMPGTWFNEDEPL